MTHTKDAINWTEHAEQRVNECIADVKFYIDSGIPVQRSIEIVLSSTTLGPQYKQRIVDAFKQS